MINRKLKADIEDCLKNFPVVGIVGTRQVGKTTLSKMIADESSQNIVYLDLELPSDLAKLDEAELYLKQYTDSLVIIDEIQRRPELFPVLRALVDSDRKPGRFLILGSASPDLIKQSSESLAGRIYYHELAPFSFDEIGTSKDSINKLWSRGGYPQSFLAVSDRISSRWRDAFIQTHLERDIPNLGFHTPASALQRFWLMLAHCHGQLWNASKIANSLGVDPKTVRRYLDILQDTFMIRQLQPCRANIKKRLVKSPKIYLRDSGLLHSLLRIQSFDELLGHPVADPSWEGWCIEQILSIIPRTSMISFYRTSAGAEIDLITQISGTKPIIAIEIKYSLEPRPAKGFWSAFSDFESAQGLVVYPGSEYYPLSKKVFALPVSQLHRILEI